MMHIHRVHLLELDTLDINGKHAILFGTVLHIVLN